MTPRRFAWWLAAITLGGLVVRVAYILVERRDFDFTGGQFYGDAFFYHEGAKLLVDGRGFISPLELAQTGRVVEAADHPPLYILWLAIPTSVGLDTELAHVLWSAVAGTATVALTGLLGREVAGPRVGVVAAALAAVYPNIWSHDGALMAETLALTATTGTLLLAYRYVHAPSLPRLVWVAAGASIAALARSELVLLLVLLVVPLALLTRTVELRDRFRWLVGAGVAAALVLAPWVVFNISRFDRPIYLSSQFETTLAVSNCDDTYYGEGIGYWSLVCAVPTALQAREDGLDQSGEADRLREVALDYISSHKQRLPVVIAARWARITGVYNPSHTIKIEQVPEGRERWVAVTGLVSLWAVLVLSVAGAVVLRRRRIAVYPLLAAPAAVLIAVTITFATHRYRASAESALVVLAAVAIDAGWRRVRARRATAAEAGPDRPPATVSQ
ncbi:MAG: glycosyltransferase family 39 protein [Acidimicrobiia bacterium]